MRLTILLIAYGAFVEFSWFAYKAQYPDSEPRGLAVIELSNVLAAWLKSVDDGAVPNGRSEIKILFDPGSATLTLEARRRLADLAKTFKGTASADKIIRLVGHADPRGSAAENLALSRLRAESVYDYLVREQGLEADRLRLAAQGDTRPLNPRDPAAAVNRRVDLISIEEP